MQDRSSMWLQYPTPETATRTPHPSVPWHFDCSKISPLIGGQPPGALLPGSGPFTMGRIRQLGKTTEYSNLRHQQDLNPHPARGRNSLNEPPTPRSYPPLVSEAKFYSQMPFLSSTHFCRLLRHAGVH